MRDKGGLSGGCFVDSCSARRKRKGERQPRTGKGLSEGSGSLSRSTGESILWEEEAKGKRAEFVWGENERGHDDWKKVIVGRGQRFFT